MHSLKKERGEERISKNKGEKVCRRVVYHSVWHYHAGGGADTFLQHYSSKHLASEALSAEEVSHQC